MTTLQETRTELTENDFLNMQLGQIEPQEAIRLLIEDIKASENHVDECLGRIEGLEMAQYRAKNCLDELANRLEDNIESLAEDLKAGISYSQNDIKDLFQDCLAWYAQAFVHLEE